MDEQQDLPLRRRAPEPGQPAATAWMHDGELVNAFPWAPRSPEQWAQHDRDGYWSSKGYREAPLFLRAQDHSGLAHWPILYSILAPAIATGQAAVRHHGERLAEVLEGDQLDALRELLDRKRPVEQPARVIASGGHTGCTRSHPHENMSDECVELTAAARAARAGEAEYRSWRVLPSRTQYERHLERGLEGWRTNCEFALREVDRLSAEVGLRAKHQDRDVWFWQDDGYDHLRSMGRHMVVVIAAPVLQRLVSTGTTVGGAQQQ